jgi:hypothetical protein
MLATKTGLKSSPEYFYEAKLEFSYIHNAPYPSALSTEKTPGLNKVRKLPSDHLCQTPQAPKIK